MLGPPRFLITVAASIGFVLNAAASAGACGDPSIAVERARQGDPLAIAELRSMGPVGLAAFAEAHYHQLLQYRKSAAEGAGRTGLNGEWTWLVTAMDGIAAQYDAAWSELYWYTDLEEAKNAARAAGKLIVSLRLLGRLDEELSCANSRFFRTTLYANQSVADLLRDRFVLHWESVRPVPVITIDYGDGRFLKTTITGNSIHYVLTPQGKVVDALPGLWSVSDFMRALLIAERAPVESLAAHRQYLIDTIDFERHERGILPGEPLDGRQRPIGLAAQARTVTKGAIEIPLLKRAIPDIDRRLATVGMTRWDVAALDEPASPLDQRSSALLRAIMRFSNEGAGKLDWVAAQLKLGRSAAAESLRNRLDLRRHVLALIQANAALEQDVAALNDRVYADVFLTPKSDPWMGMVEPYAFSALWGGSAHEAPSAVSNASK